MAKAVDGHWVTIKGTHVLIGKGGFAGFDHHGNVKKAIAKHNKANPPNTRKADAYATKTLSRAMGKGSRGPNTGREDAYATKTLSKAMSHRRKGTTLASATRALGRHSYK